MQGPLRWIEMACHVGTGEVYNEMQVVQLQEGYHDMQTYRCK